MSMLSKLGGSVKKLVTHPKDWASSIAHQATDPKTILGIAGTLALPGAGALLSKIPLVGGTLAAGAGAASGALNSGVGKVLSPLLGVGGASNGAGATPGFNPAIPDSAMGLPSGGGGNSSSLLNMLMQAGALGSGVYNTVQSNKYRGKAVNQATDAYSADAPLRDAAKKKLLSPFTPDLSDVYQNEQNPFSSRYRTVGGS